MIYKDRTKIELIDSCCALKIQNKKYSNLLIKKNAELRSFKLHLKKIIRHINYLIEHPYTENFHEVKTVNERGAEKRKGNDKKFI